MDADDTCVEIDQIIIHLSRMNTLKKLLLKLDYTYKLPLFFFSLHQLTKLSLHKCDTFNGFGSFSCLYLFYVNITIKTLLHLISKSPLHKRLALMLKDYNYIGGLDSIILDLLKCLPLIEELTVSLNGIQYPAHGTETIPEDSLVYLKYLCMDDMISFQKYTLPFVDLLIKRSSIQTWRKLS